MNNIEEFNSPIDIREMITGTTTLIGISLAEGPLDKQVIDQYLLYLINRFNANEVCFTVTNKHRLILATPPLKYTIARAYHLALCAKNSTNYRQDEESVFSGQCRLTIEAGILKKSLLIGPEALQNSHYLSNRDILGLYGFELLES